MFHPDHSLGPGSASLLAELGIDPAAVREVVEHDRAMRCPDRAAGFPACGFASFAPEPAPDCGLHEPALSEPWDPASSLPPADGRWRRA